MDFQEISIEQLIDEINADTSVFLCGNGFSMNFDKSYKIDNLSKTLYETHCHLKSFQQYDIYPKDNLFYNICTNNYKQTKKVLNCMRNEEDFYFLFESAVIFAKSISNSKIVIDWLNKENYNNTLTFGLCSLDLVTSIVDQAETNSIMHVNYEFWSVLIYFALALRSAPPNVYIHDVNNLFIQATLHGTTQTISNSESKMGNLYADTAINGMYTYFRFLFTANILLKGKSCNVEELELWPQFDIDCLSSFLNGFNHLITTNYDLLLEKITNRSDVEHLHGSFSKTKKRVLAQSLGVSYNLTRFDLSTLIFGDYFLSKSFYPSALKLSEKFPNSTKTKSYLDITNQLITENNAQNIVIFGLNIENDYHIIRNLQYTLAVNNCPNNKIIYCYYDSSDKETFLNTYCDCITFSTEINNKVKNKIQPQIINSHEIINKFFIIN